MPTTDEQLSKLQMAAAIMMFDRSLRGVASTITLYGIIFTGIGVIITFATAWGLISVAFGVALFVEAYYIAKVRSPRVVLLAGFTLGAFAVWLIGSFIMAWIAHDPSRGKGIIAGFFLSYGTWNMFGSYRNYKALLENSNSETNAEVRSILENLRKNKKADEVPELVEFKIRGFSQTGFWRMMPKDDLFLLANFGDKTFGRAGQLERAVWIRKNDLRLETEGGKWIGKNLNAKLILPAEELKIEVSPSMLERLQKTLGTGYVSSTFNLQ